MSAVPVVVIAGFLCGVLMLRILGARLERARPRVARVPGRRAR
ncbi:hypothetical protein AB0H76_04985 [Nocardia sp. NPDC050712]